ncbi:MAG: tetratricopeptide repeat protein [Deltaproteobacteria bacterium]|nr:tetratricopeptide repeat protein [Deltaproteobacteria bacterium]
MIHAITAALGAQLSSAEYDRAEEAKSADLGAWEWLQRALAMVAHHHSSMAAVEGYEKAFAHLDRALEADPDYAYAHAVKAWYHFAIVINGLSQDSEADFRRGLDALQEVQRLGSDDPLCLFYVGSARLFAGQFERAISTLSRALERNPNSADALLHLGMAYGFMGEFERAHQEIDRAQRLAPTGGFAFAHQWYRAIIYSVEGRQGDAIELIQHHLDQAPRYTAARLMLAACQAETGRVDDARASVKRAARDAPSMDADHLPPMLSAHADPEAGERRMQLLRDLWNEVTA